MIKRLSLLFSLLTILLLLTTSVNAWWNTSWEYRVPINVTNQINYEIKTYKLRIYFDTRNLISSGKMQPDCDDISLTFYNTSIDEEKEVPYYIESGCNTNTTKVWLTVPYLPPSSDTTMYLYYGNPSTLSGSEEKKTCPGNVSIVNGYCWEIYDDFIDNSLDSRWEYSYIRKEAFSNIREGTCLLSDTGCWIVDVSGGSD
jgi:MSHA biogenesis protein MshQ